MEHQRKKISSRLLFSRNKTKIPKNVKISSFYGRFDCSTDYENIQIRVLLSLEAVDKIARSFWLCNRDEVARVNNYSKSSNYWFRFLRNKIFLRNNLATQIKEKLTSFRYFKSKI